MRRRMLLRSQNHLDATVLLVSEGPVHLGRLVQRDTVGDDK
jgi:hypothetical protein